MALLLNFQTLLRLPNTASRRPPGENGGDKNSPRSQERAKAPRRRKSGKRQKEQTIWVVGWALKKRRADAFRTRRRRTEGRNQSRGGGYAKFYSHSGLDPPNSKTLKLKKVSAPRSGRFFSRFFGKNQFFFVFPGVAQGYISRAFSIFCFFGLFMMFFWRIFFLLAGSAQKSLLKFAWAW